MRVVEIIFSVVIGIVSVGFGGGGLKDLPASGKDYDAVTGREIYSNTCIRCHGIDGKGAMGLQLVPNRAFRAVWTPVSSNEFTMASQIPRWGRGVLRYQTTKSGMSWPMCGH